MPEATNRRWWAFLIVALMLVFAWPPAGDKSLAMKFTNWVVDPTGALPVLPDPLALGLGDDPMAVAAHDEEVQRYDALYVRGGWTRRRLELKTATDPFKPATVRQVLTALGVLEAFLFWRFAKTGIKN